MAHARRIKWSCIVGRRTDSVFVHTQLVSVHLRAPASVLNYYLEANQTGFLIKPMLASCFDIVRLCLNLWNFAHKSKRPVFRRRTLSNADGAVPVDYALVAVALLRPLSQVAVLVS